MSRALLLVPVKTLLITHFYTIQSKIEIKYNYFSYLLIEYKNVIVDVFKFTILLYYLIKFTPYNILF